MSGMFMFTFTERELSLLADVLDQAVEAGPVGRWSRDDVAEVAAMVTSRLAW